MSAQQTELFARLIDLFGNPATADPTKLYNNLTVNPNGTVQIGTGLIMPDGYTRNLTDMGRNRIINGGMDIWQRSTSVTGVLASYQTVDRFGCSTVSANTLSQSTDVPNAGFTYSLKFTVGTGSAPAAGAFNGFWQNIEGYNLTDFAFGKTLVATGTLSFWVKSSVAGTFALSFMNGSLNRNYISTYTVTTANTWQYVTITLPSDTAGTWYANNLNGLSICWDMGSGSTYQTANLNTWQAGQIYGTTTSTKLTATTNATFQITGVQFELGNLSSPFERRLMANEFANCQRYFQLGSTGTGTQASTTTAWIFGPLQGTMRAAPTVVVPAAVTIYGNGTNTVMTSFASFSTFPQSWNGLATFSAQGAVGNNVTLTSGSGNVLQFNAEL